MIILVKCQIAYQGDHILLGLYTCAFKIYAPVHWVPEQLTRLQYDTYTYNYYMYTKLHILSIHILHISLYCSFQKSCGRQIFQCRCSLWTAWFDSSQGVNWQTKSYKNVQLCKSFQTIQTALSYYSSVQIIIFWNLPRWSCSVNLLNK